MRLFLLHVQPLEQMFRQFSGGRDCLSVYLNGLKGGLNWELNREEQHVSALHAFHLSLLQSHWAQIDRK